MKILILHGWGQSSSLWKQLASKLNSLSPTEAIDLPGFGNEPLVSPDWGIADYAKWTESYIKSHKLKDVVLIGHSFGGKIATHVAIKNPQWLKKIILIGSPVLYRPSTITKVKIATYKLAKNILPKSLRTKFYSYDLKKAVDSRMGKIYGNSVRYDQTENLQKIAKPTLIIWGDRDEEASIDIARQMQKLIPNSKLEVLKNTGHQIHLQNPYILYGFIKKFISIQ